MRQERITETLRKSWSCKTSAQWTADRPALGQCAVTALVLQDQFGGQILKTYVGDAWHFYNKFDDEIHDYTAEQFEQSVEYSDVLATRDDAMSNCSADEYRELARVFFLNWSVDDS